MNIISSKLIVCLWAAIVVLTAAQNICQIPSQAPLQRGCQGLGQINLAQLNLNILDPAMFVNLPMEVTSVHIQLNQISSLPTNLALGIPGLAQLYAYNNTLSVIPPGFFASNTNLTEVDFSSNQLTNLDADLFANNPNLQFVYFTGNQLSSIGASFFINNPLIEEISFARNNFVAFAPGTFAALTNLTKLYLSENPNLVEVPGELGLLPNLDVLTLPPQVNCIRNGDALSIQAMVNSTDYVGPDLTLLPPCVGAVPA